MQVYILLFIVAKFFENEQWKDFFFIMYWWICSLIPPLPICYELFYPLLVVNKNQFS